MKLFSFITKKSKKYTLVISGGGTRGFYALGVLKGLEQLGYKDKIASIYGVSVGAIIASYRAAGYSADQIFQEFMNTKKLFNITALNIFSKKSLLKNTTLQQRFTKDLPQYISDLPKKVYIGATDIHTAKFVLFDKGELVPILLGSIAIPGVFPPIEYKNHMYIDGGTSNNFPVSLAKKAYPKQELIGISLNKFKENQPIKTIVDILSVSFEILLRHDMVHSLPLIDHVFYPDIILKILDTNKKNIQKTYDQGYQDCMKHFHKEGKALIGG